jgi:regulator of protease activity HflC (stomatin/prohibitin superfamily)
MMGLLLLSVFIVAALASLAATVRVQSGVARKGLVLLAGVLLLAGVATSSVTYVPSDKVGIVYKNALGSALPGGKIISVNGEMGVQADVLAPGWHLGYWPVLFTVNNVDLIEIRSDDVGLIEASDGVPLEGDQLFAPDFKTDEFQQMLDARYFLTTGKGFKGKQASVLKPGKYRLNTELFRVTMVKQTEIVPGEIGVLKANYGKAPSLLLARPKPPAGDASNPTDVAAAADELAIEEIKFASDGERGIRAAVLTPGKYALNTDAYTVTEMWTTQMIAHYTAAGAEVNPTTKPKSGKSQAPAPEEREITVRTSDGFTFPVDVRIEYLVTPADAPLVVAKLGDDEGDRFRNALNSAVRAIFRNNAESVRALDYVQQRSHQESQSLGMLRGQMARFGVTVTAVRIGNVGDELSLGTLLKTQTDRELAKQEQMTFQEQQKAANQKKELSRATQEAEEEKKLATATYEVKIADESQKKKVIEARAEAESTKIKATAQAEAYKQIAEQIGKSNAALIEVLKIVGERNIVITPRIMVSGQGRDGASRDGAITALIGTILDRATNEESAEVGPPPPKAP